MTFRPLQTGILGALSLTAISAQADAVVDWNSALLKSARASRINPPAFSRAAAITHLAVYDSVNGIQRNHQPYHVTTTAPQGASMDAAISAAAHTALIKLFPNADIQSTNLTALYTASLAAIPDGQAKTDGVAWGASVANAILALRANDGSTNVVAYTNAPAPGIWRPTPPANAAPLLPAWGRVTPFGIVSAEQFRPHQPPSLTSSAYILEFEITKNYGAKTNSIRTADQTEIAFFWSDGGGTETPPGHWNHIAQDVSLARGLSVNENARLFALVNIALADAAICAWDTKYAFNLWRPITAVREADTDNNPSTIADPTWESLIGTPPFPEFTSGHSTFSRSAATVLSRFFGTDAIPFIAKSDSLPGVTRSYPGFSAAADESGISRIYGGIHWESGNIAGQTVGHFIGRHVMDYYLRPLSAPSFAMVKVADQKVDLQLRGEAGRSYLIQGSTDLNTWIQIAIATSENGEISANDTTQQPHRFYRAIAL